MNERDRLLAQLQAENADLRVRLEASQYSSITLESLPDLAFVLDEDGDYVDVSTPDAAMLSVEREELIGKNLRDYFPVEIAEQAIAAIRRAVALGQPQLLEYPVLLADEERWFEAHIAKIESAPGQPARVICLARDITERNRSRQALAESDARLHAAIESLPFDFFLLDLDGRYALINSKTQESYRDVIGKRPEDLDVDANTLAVWKANNRRAFAGETIREEVSFGLGGQQRHYDNVVTPVKDGEQILGILGVNIDITERKRLEEEHQRTRRLEALGLFAGGLAHDFNNMLTGVIGNLSVLQSRSRLASDDLQLVTDAEKACLRASGLTRQLLTFAKGGHPVLAVLDLEKLAREISDFAVKDSNCRCVYRVAPELRPVVADPDQLSQIIQNLVQNAAQAMPDGGVIQLSLDNLQAGSAAAVEWPDDDYVCLAVSDSGCGMTESQVQQMFDPFYTTRAGGHGLGLAIVASIVEKHGGKIRAESLPGSGTRVEVCLRASKTEPARNRGEAPIPSPGTGRILVMDDDQPVCQAIGMILKGLGYLPTLTQDGAEAVTAFRQAVVANTPFQAVILDLTVKQGQGGKECVQELAQIDPQLRAIVTSGYCNDPVMAHYRRFGFAAALSKPFSLNDLAITLDRVLQPQGGNDARHSDG